MGREQEGKPKSRPGWKGRFPYTPYPPRPAPDLFHVSQLACTSVSTSPLSHRRHCRQS